MLEEGFALRGDLLCPRRQSRQNAAGNGPGHIFDVTIVLSPDPGFYRGSRQCNVPVVPAQVVGCEISVLDSLLLVRWLPELLR